MLSLGQTTTVYNGVILDCDLTRLDMSENIFSAIVFYTFTGRLKQHPFPLRLTGLVVKEINGTAERVGYFQLRRGRFNDSSTGTVEDLEGSHQQRLLQIAQKRTIRLG